MIGKSIDEIFILSTQLFKVNHIYQKLIDCAGQKKIIWGSDYPLRIYPGISSQPDFLSFLKEFKSSVHLDEEQLENVLGKNIENLLK